MCEESTSYQTNDNSPNLNDNINDNNNHQHNCNNQKRLQNSKNNSSNNNSNCNDSNKRSKDKTKPSSQNDDHPITTTSNIQNEDQQDQKSQIESLQKQLRDQQEAMARLQAHTHAHQIQSNLTTSALRMKLRRKEQDVKSLKSQHESCVSVVISHLLYLEGQIQKEHHRAVAIIQDKDDTIRRQRAALEELSSRNDRLLVALKETAGYDFPENNGMVTMRQPPPSSSLSQSGIPVVTQNGKYSIQDHGNKVVLRNSTNSSNIAKGAPPSSSSGGGSSGHKVRFSSMKERLRRHKSSLELYHTEPLEPLVEGTLRYFGSQENLLVDGDTSGYSGGGSSGSASSVRAAINRKQRCRSLIEVPSDLQEADEIHNESPDSCFGEESSLSSENIYGQSESFSYGGMHHQQPNHHHHHHYHNSSSAYYSTSQGRMGGVAGAYNQGARSKSTISLPSQFGLSELSKSRSVPQALPTVTENGGDGIDGRNRERPHSLPGAGFLTDAKPGVVSYLPGGGVGGTGTGSGISSSFSSSKINGKGHNSIIPSSSTIAVRSSSSSSSISSIPSSPSYYSSPNSSSSIISSHSSSSNQPQSSAASGMTGVNSTSTASNNNNASSMLSSSSSSSVAAAGSSSTSSNNNNNTTNTSSSSSSESNPFKSFKNVFKRRGSKKKRSVSLGQAQNQEYQATLKQHFKKYDLT